MIRLRKKLVSVVFAIVECVRKKRSVAAAAQNKERKGAGYDGFGLVKNTVGG